MNANKWRFVGGKVSSNHFYGIEILFWIINNFVRVNEGKRGPRIFEAQSEVHRSIALT